LGPLLGPTQKGNPSSSRSKKKKNQFAKSKETRKGICAGGYDVRGMLAAEVGKGREEKGFIAAKKIVFLLGREHTFEVVWDGRKKKV